MLSLKDWLKSSIFFKFVVFVDFFEVEVESHEVFTLHILLGGGLIQIFFHFDPWDEWSNLTSIFFSMGWNHHLVIIFFCLLSICCVKLFENHGLSVGTTIGLTWLKFWECVLLVCFSIVFEYVSFLFLTPKRLFDTSPITIPQGGGVRRIFFPDQKLAEFGKARILEVGGIWWKSLKPWANFGSCRQVVFFFFKFRNRISIFKANQFFPPPKKQRNLPPSRWWQLTHFFIFTPKIGGRFPFWLTNGTSHHFFGPKNPTKNFNVFHPGNKKTHRLSTSLKKKSAKMGGRGVDVRCQFWVETVGPNFETFPKVPLFVRTYGSEIPKRCITPWDGAQTL